jgi:Tfp pilus assembly protein PilV
LRASDERGNAIVEFIVVGLIAQLLIFGFLVKFGEEFRSQIAAQTISRQVMRTVQMTGSIAASVAMADLITSVFGIPASSVQSSVADNCAANGTYQVKVQVRNKTYETSGFCLN